MIADRPVRLPSILLVDDNIDDNYIHTRRIIETGLVASADDVFVKTNGLDALRFLENYEANQRALGDRFPPRLTLLDINMPVMDGFEFLARFEALARSGRYDEMAIAILSSSEHRRDKERASSFDFVKGYLVKPADPAALLALVDGQA